MDKMQKKNQVNNLPFNNKTNWKGKRAQMLQNAGLDALSELDQKKAVKELLKEEDNSGLISH